MFFLGISKNFHKINSSVCRKELSGILFRNFSTPRMNESENVPCFLAIKLENKSLLRISGPESFIYLQSLLTNDMRKLLSQNELENSIKTNTASPISTNQTLIYSFLLSSVGKVLCDMFVYRGRFLADGEYILEVDRNLAKAIKRLLLGYNINKSIKVEIAQDLNLWSVIPETVYGGKQKNEIDHHSTLNPIDSDDLKLASDPRIEENLMGYRFLTRLGGSKLEDIGKYIKCQSNSNRIKLKEGKVKDYISLKYRLGIAEGSKDILSGFYFPFELNGDFLNAISLDKGLYTSEEKTIKIYSNQPIKRRIFPIEFLCDNHLLKMKSPAPCTIICSSNGRKLGELRQRLGRYGIASLIVPMENNTLSPHWQSNSTYSNLYHIDTGLKLKAFIPSWWPKNFDQIYLEPPNYPECLFNLKSNHCSDNEQTLIESNSCC